LPRTGGASGKVAAVIASFAPLLANAAEEGRNVILAMLVVGLIFLSVILLGELSRWARHRRH
jgi:hypothetical protein